ncbi:TonB-dependent receptor plug domain-containing protein [Solimonas marina]|uniref:TonB-dependent receptor n=1 Tax=Solimonas marina TaxID=2714601 RepID=A0A970B7Z3_9GAMM|nr:TonB-dependent receptor [Solimonas marina]
MAEVVVTGSRVQRAGYEAPTPLTVLGTEDIQAAAPANVADFVNTLPSITGSQTASTSSGSLSYGLAGISAMNLRALGAGRTLVLLDGQRSVASSATGLVDTNTFPESLVKRVEVVTGGASSQYGSDAVGGVVNFILDKEYSGVKGSVEYGQSSTYGGPNRKLTLTAGTPFAEGKGHVLFSGEVFSQNILTNVNPTWNQNGRHIMNNPDTSDGAPYYYVGNHIGVRTYTPGGLITSGNLAGTYFGNGGTINQLDYGASTGSGLWMQGGDWEYTGSSIAGTNSLQPSEHRQNVFGRVSYYVLPETEVFAQASYARYKGESYYIRGPMTATIQSDNAYLPSDIASAMSSSSFSMGLGMADFDASGTHNGRSVQRYVVGGDGKFDIFKKSFTWNAYYQKGVANTDEHETPTYNKTNLAYAIDSIVDDNGDIVCRDETARAAGCVPFNPFGVGVSSQESRDYIIGDPRRTQQFNQDVASVSFNTNDIEGWAGPISVAFGGEWRVESMDGDVSKYFLDTVGQWKYGNYVVSKGSYNVKEAFVETVVPIMKGMDFDGAYRRTNYSVSGGVNTWKLGLTYAPIDDIKFRASRSRDIRAPNLSELYSAGTALTNSVNFYNSATDTTDNYTYYQKLTGSKDISPEVANASGFGVVLQPRWVPDLAFSIDYYQVKLKGVIDYLTASQIAQYCGYNNQYCDQMHWANDVVGSTLDEIDLYYQNLNKMISRGVDFEGSYRVHMGDWISGAGNLDLRAMATHYITNTTDDGTTAINEAGANGGSTPDWLYRLTATYKQAGWIYNVTARGVSKGHIDNSYIQCSSGCSSDTASGYYTINDNHVPSWWIFNASLTRSFALASGEGQVFVAVNNLLGRDPPVIGNLGYENSPGYLQTNRTLYDVMGRTWRMGVRFSF